MLKEFLFFIFIVNIFLISCNRSSSNDNNNNASYSGPPECISIPNEIVPLKMSIVGGNRVKKPEDPLTPSNALTGNNTVAVSLGDILCSGTIVADNLILTAGHCFDHVKKNIKSPGHIIFDDNDNKIKNPNGEYENYAEISCWQRPSNYISCSETNSIRCILNDVAWVKINGNLTKFTDYSAISILSNPETIDPTEEKWMLGFGILDHNTRNEDPAYKYMVKSDSSTSFPDTTPFGAIEEFNSYTFDNAFQKYLTVIGPNNDSTNGKPKGTCNGDSGGPVYVKRNGNYVLAALTQGSNSLLSPHPKTTSPPYSFDFSQYASCDDGYGVYTTVGNYVDWISSTSGVNLSIY